MELRTGEFPPVTATAEVVVQEKPVFVSSGRSEILGDYGSPITLPCDVVGIPQPNVTWYKNTELIDETVDSRYEIEEDNSLLIKKLLMSDMGMFQCFARNIAGENSISTWLKVKSKSFSFLIFFLSQINFNCVEFLKIPW